MSKQQTIPHKVYRFVKTSLAAIGVMVILPTGVDAQETQSFDLKNAMNYAVEHREEVEKARIEQRVADKRVWESIASGLPQISAEGQFQQFIDIPRSVVSASFFDPTAPPDALVDFQMGTEFSASLNLQVNQLLFDGSYIVGLGVSQYYKDFVDRQLRLEERDVNVSVAQAYYQALVAKENVRLSDSIALQTQDIYDAMRIMEEEGFIESIEAERLEVAQNNAQNSVKRAHLQYRSALDFLKFTMGYPQGDTLVIETNLEDEVNQALAMQADTSFNAEELPDYKVLDGQVTLNEFQVKLDKSKNMPTLVAYFQHGQNAYRNEFDFFQNKPWYPTSVWGLQLSIPITSSGMRWAKQKQSELKVDQLQEDKSQFVRSLELSNRNAHYQFLLAYNNYEAASRNVDLAKNILEGEVLKREIGTADALRVLQAQNQYFIEQASYIGTLVDLFKAKIELDKIHNRF